MTIVLLVGLLGLALGFHVAIRYGQWKSSYGIYIHARWNWRFLFSRNAYLKWLIYDDVLRLLNGKR